MRKLASLLAISSLSFSGANAAVTASNLVAFYDFNGNTNDGSGNGATGALTEGAVISADGTGYSSNPGDSALDLGSSQGNTANGVQSRSVSTVDLSSTTANNSIAISFWQYDIGNGAGGNAATSAFGLDFGANDRGVGTHTPWSDGTLYFDHGGCCSPAQRLTAPVGTSLLDSWHHIVLQIDNGNKQIWVDGVLEAEQATGAGAVPTFTGSVNVGAQYNEIHSFGGRIDEFAIWDVALEQSEIQALAGGASTLSIIPEPSSSLLVLLSGMFLIRRRR